MADSTNLSPEPPIPASPVPSIPLNPVSVPPLSHHPRWVYLAYVGAAIIGYALSLLRGEHPTITLPVLPLESAAVAPDAAELDRRIAADTKAAHAQYAALSENGEALYYCPVREQLNETPKLEARIPGPKIFWTVKPKAYPDYDLTEKDVVNTFSNAWAAWDKGAVINPSYVVWGSGSAVNVSSHFQHIDGPGQVLAWSELADGSKRMLTQRYDDERWSQDVKAGRISLKQVCIHEIGHALGLQHDASNSGSLMAPVLNAKILEPTDRDFERLYGLGYDRRVVTPPTASPDTISVPATFRIQDLMTEFDKRGLKLVPK
jgi:hypothetical protein